MRIGLLVMVLGVTTILDAQTTYKPNSLQVVLIKPCEDGATSTRLVVHAAPPVAVDRAHRQAMSTGPA